MQFREKNISSVFLHSYNFEVSCPQYTLNFEDESCLHVSRYFDEIKPSEAGVRITVRLSPEEHSELQSIIKNRLTLPE